MSRKTCAAAVENGGDPGGIGSLVSRADWGELERQRSDEEQLAESSLAASAPDSAALRAQVSPLTKPWRSMGVLITAAGVLSLLIINSA